MSDDKEYLTLKWGTLKEWNIISEEAKKLLARYFEIGASMSCMAQRDTPEQKKIICDLIDLMPGETIFMDWDGIDVSKEEAKKYVMEYGIN